MNSFFVAQQRLLDSARNVSGGQSVSASSVLTNIANAFVFVIGAAAVIMLIIGGLRYVLSGGNPQAAAGAKNTILYALIGVAVAIAAFAIVNFVVVRI